MNRTLIVTAFLLLFALNCLANEPPQFRNIPDQEIEMNSPAIYHLLDLWDYAYDPDNADYELLFDVLSQSNPALIDCNLTDIHFIGCDAPAANSIGTNIVTVKATDLNLAYDTETFEIHVFDPAARNQAPEISGLPDKTIGLNAGASSKIVDLRLYASDDQTPLDDLNYTITQQSSTDTIRCFLEDRYYLSCFSPQRIGYSDITIQVKDSYGRTDDDVMRINVVQGQGPDGIEITSEIETVFLARNDSIVVQLTIRNNSGSRKCLELNAETDSHYIEAEPSLSSICLNANEQTNVTLSIRAVDAPISSYGATLIAESSEGITTYAIEVKIMGESEIEMAVYDSDICRADTDYFSVLVKNNSNELKRIRLWADNEMLLPYFSPDELTLDAFEQEYVKVYVHTSRNTTVGTYNISLFAETGSEQVKETASIRVKDCIGEEIDFTVELSSGCQYADKGKEERVSYIVRNLTSRRIELRAAVVSDLPTEYDSRIALEENERKTFSIKVKPRMGDDVGRHDLTLIVWNADTTRSEEKTKCVYVREKAASEVEIITNNLKVERGSNEVFTLLVRNTGDTELDYRISIVEDINSVRFDVSETRFGLDSKEEKYIYISVTTMEEATPLGNYEFDVIVRFGGESITRTLKFEVMEKLPEREQELEITSYPIQVKVEKGKETTFIVSIKNNTEQQLSSITVQLIDLPAGAFAPSVKNLSLNAGQSRDVQLYVKATNVAEGTYRAKIEAKTLEFKTSKEIEFIVEAPVAEGGEEEEAPEGFLAGLISIGSSVLLGLVALIIVIALIVLMGKVFGRYSNRKPREVWLRGG